MPACCRCNASGRCRGCSCRKSGKPCVDRLPSRLGRCENLLSSDTTVADSVSDSPSSSTLHSPDRPDDSGTELPSITACSESVTSHSLPSFPQCHEPAFTWGIVDGASFTHSITCCYAEVVHWRRNVFKIPSGKSGNSFIRELTRLIRAYAEGSAMESVALKAAMIMPSLLLQKSHRTSKAKDHVAQLERRLKSWEDGDIDSLLLEGRTIQRQLTTSSNKTTMSDEHLACSFPKLMMVGKVKAALRLITDHSKGGLLPLDSLITTADSTTETVRQSVTNKHPPGRPLKPSAISSSDPTIPEPHPVLFDQIDGSLIRTVALRTEGAAGPSGIDASGWKRMCTSFRAFSADLCDALASLARRICTSYVDPEGLAAFVSCRLIALDKCPGVRPIGIGETAR